MKTILSILLLFFIVITMLSTSTTAKNIESKISGNGIDIYVYQNGSPVYSAFVKVSGNGFEECCYTSESGKCRIQVPSDGYYGFCASKNHYGDSKTVYISGGTAIVYLYLKTYGLECSPCQNPEKH